MTIDTTSTTSTTSTTAAPRRPAEAALRALADVPPRRVGSRRGRVLVVHSSDELYGSDRIVLEVVAELAARDDLDVTVWLPTDVEAGPLGPLLRERGARVERAPLPILRRRGMRLGGMAGLLRDAAKTAARLAGRHFDLVWCATSACLVVAPLARLARVDSVVGHLQEPWGDGDRAGLSVLARSCTSLVAVSHSVLESAGLQDDDRAHVVHNGVARKDADASRVPEHRLPHYVVASRWNPHKGHATLLAAWNAAGCPGQLTILGGPPAVGTGVDVPGLVAAVVSRPETVTVVGEVDDASAWVRDADAVVLPTDTLEGFGIVALEAFSQGRAVIASRSGGPEEVVEDGRTGWLFDRRDVDGLAELFAGLDVDQLATAGTRALATWEERFTPDRMRRRLAAVVLRELHVHADLDAALPVAVAS
jgi:glycosyltransferase involved in cell wall biosynthesis